ncbi:hypothetical protein IMG5_130470 [Ichthyophthirius multifiliis]|uniref:Uncharacterized protein n=1 Tax=Ichthyophthirius multifiliis TaxID=5932 RepID=G0QWA1_ICHMU|nr:hypothetical protein IMG5_130470 [Ichthyophthirius multifiliis]EGR30496.1 hypothetical protein IMG5_130470 [Ichthyophthirius multifiliis]|eukprot:XP_004032083.1 hypothetical protein IMG5_130470 [Ichthyophthirius multifiliis]
MFSQFFKRSNQSKKKVDLEEKENYPFLQEQSTCKQDLTQKNNNQQFIPIPKGHEKYSEKDKEKCPYFSMQQKQEQSSTNEKDPQKKKEKKPKGGCPFMPSERKKNPSLNSCEEGWNEEYVSPQSYLIDYRGFLSFSFDQLEKPDFNLKEKRKIFDTFPVYLKHTLFMKDENMKKVRELEVAQRFFVYDKLREKGNKEFNKGNAEESIKYYEQALSCFKWLEHVEKEEDEQEEEIKFELSEEERKAEQERDDEIRKDPFFKNLPRETEQERIERLKLLQQIRQEKKEFRKKYKGLMTTYTDDNVILKDGEELTDSQDIEMRQSMLMTIYMSLAVAYMKCFYFKMAQVALDDALKITQKSSQIYFRKSQCVAYNKFSDLKELEQAKKDIEQAIEMKQYEKIFQQEQGILRIMNLLDHNECYINLAHYVVKRIKERTEYETELISKLFQREKHIEEVEQQLIDEGKTPYEEGEETLSQANIIPINEEHQEYEIILEMMRKYYRVIEFYTETKKPDQVRIAKKELQQLSETVCVMNYLLKLNFKNYKENSLMIKLKKEYDIDLENEKILRRLERLKKNKAKSIFENGNYNFEVFQYAIKDYFKKKEEKEKKEKEEKEAEENENNQENLTVKQTGFRKVISNIFSCEFILQATLVGMIFGFFYYMTTKDNMISMFIFDQMK